MIASNQRKQAAEAARSSLLALRKLGFAFAGHSYIRLQVTSETVQQSLTHQVVVKYTNSSKERATGPYVGH